MMSDVESQAERPHMEAYVQITQSGKYDHHESTAGPPEKKKKKNSKCDNISSG